MGSHGLITKFTNCCLLRDHKIIEDDLWVQDGKIIDPMELFYKHKKVYDQVVDCGGALISPGYIDLQINGGFGCDFSHDIENTEECVRKVAKGILPHGVTSFCPTLVTSGPHVYKKVIPRIKKEQGGEHGASVLGVHCEGPFISPAKKGAHSLSSIKDIDQVSTQALQIIDTYGCLENIVIVTLAPEMPNALDMIEFLANESIVVSLGHSNASIDVSIKGVEKGATFITHLFNAMSPFHHRDPGIVGLLASHYKNVYFGLITDGIHTHPAAMRIAHRTHSDGTVVVTDALSALGLPDGIHYLGSNSVEVKNGCAYIAGTDTICGSITNFADCIRIFKQSTVINITLPDEKSNYVHRIGRVGRAERMGLAISLVSSVPEKVWFHGEWCSSRGRNCWNTRLTDSGGCCVWYNEPRYLADIEEHLNVTIQQVTPELDVPVDEFDGKVTYGQKKQNLGSGYVNHVAQMAPLRSKS